MFSDYESDGNEVDQPDESSFAYVDTLDIG